MCRAFQRLLAVILLTLVSCGLFDDVSEIDLPTTVSSNRETPTITPPSSPVTVKFDNHRLYSVALPAEASPVKQLLKLRDKLQIDFWNEPEPNGKVNFLVSPYFTAEIEFFLNSSSLTYSIVTDNLQQWIDKEREEITLSASDFLSGRQEAKSFSLDHYHTYQEIYSWLDSLERQYPSLLRISVIGKTHEKHDIKVVKIGLPVDHNKEYGVASRNSSLNGSSTTAPPRVNISGRKDAIWIDAGIHAREWIAPATAVWIINELVTRHDSDPEIRDLLTSFDWYILPIANPDGYQYTWWTNRLWRKNRATPKALPLRYPWALFDECIGTDPNRNFDVDFGGASTSSNPCSDIFRGDHAFSEKETIAIRDAILDLGKDLKGFISLHSFSQMWMFPWGYSSKRSPHHSELSELILRVVLAVQKKHNVWYRHGPIATTIYPAAGSSPDWVHEKVGVKHSFIAELRDRGDHGFILPRQQIIPTAEETWEGIKVIAEELKRKNS
jgi:murein tripeptide amidase MpaA